MSATVSVEQSLSTAGYPPRLKIEDVWLADSVWRDEKRKQRLALWLIASGLRKPVSLYSGYSQFAISREFLSGIGSR